jgi:hypothetical protein
LAYVGKCLIKGFLDKVKGIAKKTRNFVENEEVVAEA